MRKKLDPRIRTLIENNLLTFCRSLFVIVGDRGKDQVINLHSLWLSINRQKNPDFNAAAKPRVCWAYKTDLGFSSHQKKRRRAISKLMKQGLYEKTTEDPFELFLTKSDIRFCYYKDSEKVLGSNFDILVLQDFESLTPNILCRMVETVRGNGLIFLLLKQMTSLKQLYSLKMDVHRSFQTKNFGEVFPRFNERFLVSLAQCQSSIFVDDELNILQVSHKFTELKPTDVQQGTFPRTPIQYISISIPSIFLRQCLLIYLFINFIFILFTLHLNSYKYSNS